MSNLTTRARKRADRCDAKYADGTGALLRELSDEIEHVVSIARAHAELAEKRLEWNQGLRADNKRLSERAALVDELRRGLMAMRDAGDPPKRTSRHAEFVAAVDAANDLIARADAARGEGG